MFHTNFPNGLNRNETVKNNKRQMMWKIYCLQRFLKREFTAIPIVNLTSFINLKKKTIEQLGRLKKEKYT